MRRSRRVQRNLRRYIRKYNATEPKTAGAIRSALAVALAAIFALAVPVFSVVFAANVVFRMPDLYNFDVGRTVVADEIELNIKTDAIGDLISDYMFHKTDYFQVRAEYQGREKPVFSINDGMNMSRYRKLLDRSFIVLCASAVSGVAIFVLLRKTGRKRGLRNGYRAGIALCALAYLGMGEFVRNEGLRSTLLRVLLNVRPQNTDVLPLLFGEGYRLGAFIAIVVISGVIVIVGFSVVRLFTKVNKMF
ncbi:MAG: hypothetical protein LBH63_01700 [Clostridiales Family XIII bacterium]|jgi:hypothetical protein|nr:hypothetical protein [Clostridiales Family XIII bacterium]